MVKAPSLFVKALFLCAAALCLFDFVSGAMALIAGMLLSVSLGNPFLDLTRQNTSRLLQLAVVGLGAGVDLLVIAQVGVSSIAYTAVGIFFAIALGLLFGRVLSCPPNTSLLIAAGTAICGGSAIAAVAPTIRAKPQEVSIALAIVFLLNAIALIIFPAVGHSFALSERAFGLFSALAIHDTSSVVGAAMRYGDHALDVATTVKLTRALWIVPLTIAIGFLWNRGDKSAFLRAKRPWFIVGFVACAALVTFVPSLKAPGETVAHVAKRLLVVTLFLIGASLTRETLKAVGIRPLILGIALWACVSAATLGAILVGWIG